MESKNKSPLSLFLRLYSIGLPLTRQFVVLTLDQVVGPEEVLTGPRVDTVVLILTKDERQNVS